MTIEISRGKLIGQQGPGSLYIDTDGTSYVISAANKWYDNEIINNHINLEELKIRDTRLEKILMVDYFYEVPKFRTTYDKNRLKNTNLKIPINRFPLVEYCSICKTLSKERRVTLKGKKRRCVKCNKTTTHIQFPVIIVCEKGHLSDFPIERYTHIDTKLQYSEYKNHDIYINTHNSSSILNWTLKCRTCGAYHSLTGVTGKGNTKSSPFMNEMRGSKCFGKKPWTGDKEEVKCEEIPVAILKNSLNVYRPEMIQTLSLANNEGDDKFTIYNEILEQEFNEIINTNHSNKKLKTRISFSNNNIKTIIDSVYYVDRLEEIIVQTNFHRIEPADDENTFIKTQEIDSNNSMLFSKDVQGSWYPAKKMYGEGIFVKFRKDVLQAWNNREEVIERFKGIKERTIDFYLSERFTNPTSILMHTLSHALIREFSKHSGYTITSIKEKLYFDVNEDENGLLIYVTDSDEAGTYGGLVRLAKEKIFKQIFDKAINNIEWCSSDPVCYEYGNEIGQGLQRSNGSACHNCSYIPDISCQYRNCFLDRDFLIGHQSSVKITQNFQWFDPVESIEILRYGEEVRNNYSDWKEFSSIEQSKFYLNKGLNLPDYYDGIISYRGYKYEFKHIWLAEKEIVLFVDQRDRLDLPLEIDGWKLSYELKED